MGGLVVATAVLAAACADDGDSESSDSASDESTEADGTGSGAVQVGTVELPSSEDRAVVYTAELVVRVEDVEAAADEAIAIAEDAGGVLFEQRSDLEGDQETDLTLKVPPDSFADVRAELADLGSVRQNDVDAVDVTDEVVDLEGRLASAEASADRLRDLLADASSTSDLVTIEAELAIRESEVESLQGQLRVLNSQVELATITLHLTERADIEVSDDVPGFFSALGAGWVVFVNIVLVLVAVIGFLLPFLPFLVAAGWLGRRYLKNRPPRPRPQPAFLGPSGPPPASPPNQSPPPASLAPPIE